MEVGAASLARVQETVISSGGASDRHVCASDAADVDEGWREVARWTTRRDGIGTETGRVGRRVDGVWILARVQEIVIGSGGASDGHV